MNNNPLAFTIPDTQEDVKEKGNRQRPIVEFAVENRLVLKRRTERNRPENKTEDKKRKMGDDKRKMGDDSTGKNGSKRFKSSSKNNAVTGTSTKESKRDSPKKNSPRFAESPLKPQKKEFQNRKLGSKMDVVAPKKDQIKKVLQPKKPTSKNEKNGDSPKQRQNKVLQPKKASAKIAKKGQKTAKKMINVNISVEDIKKWNA